MKMRLDIFRLCIVEPPFEVSTCPLGRFFFPLQELSVRTYRMIARLLTNAAIATTIASATVIVSIKILLLP